MRVTVWLLKPQTWASQKERGVNQVKFTNHPLIIHEFSTTSPLTIHQLSVHFPLQTLHSRHRVSGGFQPWRLEGSAVSLGPGGFHHGEMAGNCFKMGMGQYLLLSILMG